MFTIDIIIGILKRFVGFLWEYKYTILISMIITALYIRGNNYKQDYVNENVAHVKTILEYDQQINDIRLANETALRIAQEESTANYKALVEKTSKIQQEYSQREEDINTTITKLNSSNNSLHQSIKDFTKRSPNSSSSESVRDTSDAERISTLGELLQSCVTEQDYLAIEADKIGNSVTTLQEWGNMVIENSKQIASKGDKSE